MLQAARQVPRRGDDDPVLLDGGAVDRRGIIPGNEDEDFAGVAQAVIADRDPADDVRGNVIEKDQPERQSAEEIQTQVTPGNGGSPCNGQHGYALAGSGRSGPCRCAGKAAASGSPG